MAGIGQGIGEDSNNDTLRAAITHQIAGHEVPQMRSGTINDWKSVLVPPDERKNSVLQNYIGKKVSKRTQSRASFHLSSKGSIAGPHFEPIFVASMEDQGLGIPFSDR